ncbi:MAG: SMP-30/gluconolactonase/LRE family protein [Verrucomicrobiales bacterium]|nr:SMP-30/gluconolactonase/LRE family protein [Verrucomicrobiales bacterium]
MQGIRAAVGCGLRMLGLAVVLGRASLQAWAVDAYELGPESLGRADNVPTGRLESFEFNESKIFEGTTRACWVYVPAQYDGSKPAALMVFQDGHSYIATNGSLRAPVVMDNLIAKGAMPVTIGIFVNPGHKGTNGPPSGGWGNRNNRSLEYDGLGDAYARFLIEELIPYVARRWSLKLSDDPGMTALCGQSSGGICAWTAAWERPERFGRVLSHIGSFVNIRGGHVYPALLRKTPRKAIRVFLQDGANDLNNEHGNWPLANQEMASSLAFAGYDFRFEFGDGAHNAKHGGAILPDSLRWLWRTAMEPATPTVTEGLPEMAAAGNWELVGEGYAFTDGACADAEGNFYFSDLPKGVIYRAPARGGAPVEWLKEGPKVSGMKMGPDGRVYACVQGTGTNNVKQIISLDPASRAIEVVATDVRPNDLAVSRSGFVYFTQTEDGQVVRVPISARRMSRPPPVAGGINKPNGIALSPDQRSLWVSEYGGTQVWQFSLAEDGSVRGGERLATLRVPPGKTDSGGDGSATDDAGRVYVTSHLGLQVLDSTGRSLGSIARPQEKSTVSCAFAGEGHAWLYVCSADRVYRRKTATSGAVAVRR